MHLPVVEVHTYTVSQGRRDTHRYRTLPCKDVLSGAEPVPRLTQAQTTDLAIPLRGTHTNTEIKTHGATKTTSQGKPTHTCTHKKRHTWRQKSDTKRIKTQIQSGTHKVTANSHIQPIRTHATETLKC